MDLTSTESNIQSFENSLQAFRNKMTISSVVLVTSLCLIRLLKDVMKFPDNKGRNGSQNVGLFSVKLSYMADSPRTF
jgi:hypothetical protein